MKNEQHNNNRILRMTKRIRTDLSVKRNEIIVKKKENKSCHNIKETRTKIILSNTHET